ncbi:Coenzyme F420 hydrogenase/dehydrogenase, beta subunit C-terminal domain [Brevundimonas sp.]|uniref:Coenzyme F420 hydrogenase/dehydrogenase, beta subunit C-terminal domain n=1 Tax=Brevundimonas sp. TaxID=1871086 RepID=UPI002D5C6869|nr:Coenzyme F420 hydrogenase/dehydrogenase, beta subunit C-terminal domain [Brevundimonas sp.]HYC73358.1 Coenzyme F420 hydrogenase/dehydrogenase, beta subunit C-terminal domain [Brevundimonas sp.]
MVMDVHGHLKPSGPADWRRARTAGFSALCPFSPAAVDEDDIALARYPEAPLDDPRIGRFVSAWVGHVEEGGFRAAGSSGGMANWTAAELLRTGRVDAVAHVGGLPRDGADDPLFGYRVSRSLDELGAAAKSRYHPVELSGVIETIRGTPGRYAVIGVPCFIKAVHLLRATDPVLRERIVFTLGLFCGHMKSLRMAESFAWQTGVRMEDVARMDYRLKDPGRPANVYTAQFVLKDGGERRRDWWNFADGDWGAGFFQNPACDWCDDVVAETADISFGDAWVEPYSSDGRGTNVVVARAPDLDVMLREAIAERRLRLESVDADFIHRTQAAGFRHRREGLAWRLSWPRPGKLRPRKRTAPERVGVPARRRAVYALRFQISRWSHPLFRLARRTGIPAVYLRWAGAMLALYQALAWSRGPLGALFDRLESGGGAGRARGAQPHRR